jgi:CRP-like cAMP-binding protein
MPEIQLQRGDLFHPDLLATPAESLTASAEWTRVLRVPDALYRELIRLPKLARRLRRLFETRGFWAEATDADLPLDTLLALADAGRFREFSAGDVILREGDPSRHFYVVVRGHVEVLHGQQQRRLGSFSRGYGFGEIGLLNATARSATVRATDDVTVLELTDRAFRDCLLNIPLAHYQLTRTRDRRLAELQA